MPDFTLTTFSTTPQTLTGGEIGVLVDGSASLVTPGTAIALSGTSRNQVLINGTVLVTNQGGKAVTGTGATVEIAIGPSGYVNALWDDAIGGNFSDSFYLRNSGTIHSSGSTLDIRSADGSTEIGFTNSGTILGVNDGVAFVSGSSEMRLFNSGTIIGEENFAVWGNYQGATSTGTTYFYNSGTVQGFEGAYTSSSGVGVDILTNAGTLLGHVFLGINNDRYDGAAGTVSGTVFGGEDNDSLAGGAATDVFDGGAGNDVLVGRGGDDSLDGGAGNDLMLGGAGNDSMTGGNNNDTLNGNAGDDTLEGGAGNDVLVGQDGSDLLDGGALDDILDGGNGDDTLEGGSGNDILRGRAGEDNLAGGLGLDLLTGGQDADNFVFRSLAETLVGAMRDQILDFEQGVDLIVVAGLSPGVFEFRGTAAFAPSGNPELRLFETPTGSTIVQLDTNGDGTQNAEIRVANVTGLTAEDFVL